MFFIPIRAGELPEAEACEDCGAERNAKEDRHTFRHCGIGDADVAAGVADHLDEEDGKGGIEDHLEDRVDRDKDSAVFVISAGEASPDQNLFIQCMSS